MKWSLVQRGLFFVCRGGTNAYIMQLKFMGWAYKKEAVAQFICATAPSRSMILLSERNDGLAEHYGLSVPGREAANFFSIR